MIQKQKIQLQVKMWPLNERMICHAHVKRARRVKQIPQVAGWRGKSEADYEEECLESDGLPNTGTIA